MTPETKPAVPAETAPSANAVSTPPVPSPGRAYLAEKDRTMDLRGKAYLQVAERIYAFRLDHPIESGWQIVTMLAGGSFPDKWVLWECQIIDPEGVVVATGHKQEEPPADARGCQDWVDKGETGAVGRALGNCGYGTAAALEEDPNHPCDAPRDRGQQQRPQQQAPPPRTAATKPAATAAPAKHDSTLPPCIVCGKPLDSVGRLNYCKSKNLPPSHAATACSQDAKAKVEVKS